MIETRKWLKRSKWWKLLTAILTFGFINLTMVTTATSVGWLASKQKKVKDRSVVVFWKCQGKALKSFFGLPRVHAAWNGLPMTSFRRPKMKWSTIQVMNQVKPLTSSSQHLDIAVSFSHVVRRDVYGYFGEDGQPFEFPIFFLRDQSCGLPRGDLSLRLFLANGR